MNFAGYWKSVVIARNGPFSELCVRPFPSVKKCHVCFNRRQPNAAACWARFSTRRVRCLSIAEDLGPPCSITPASGPVLPRHPCPCPCPCGTIAPVTPLPLLLPPDDTLSPLLRNQLLLLPILVDHLSTPSKGAVAAGCKPKTVPKLSVTPSPSPLLHNHHHLMIAITIIYSRAPYPPAPV